MCCSVQTHIDFNLILSYKRATYLVWIKNAFLIIWNCIGTKWKENDTQKISFFPSIFKLDFFYYTKVLREDWKWNEVHKSRNQDTHDTGCKVPHMQFIWLNMILFWTCKRELWVGFYHFVHALHPMPKSFSTLESITLRSQHVSKVSATSPRLEDDTNRMRIVNVYHPWKYPYELFSRAQNPKTAQMDRRLSDFELFWLFTSPLLTLERRFPTMSGL